MYSHRGPRTSCIHFFINWKLHGKLLNSFFSSCSLFISKYSIEYTKWKCWTPNQGEREKKRVDCTCWKERSVSWARISYLLLSTLLGHKNITQIISLIVMSLFASTTIWLVNDAQYISNERIKLNIKIDAKWMTLKHKPLRKIKRKRKSEKKREKRKQNTPKYDTTAHNIIRSDT